MTDKRKKRQSPINDGIAIPTFRIEADGRGGKLRVAVVGVVGVKEFSQNGISIVTKRDTLTFSGVGLKLSVFENKTVEIVGEITDVTFSARKRRGREI